MGMFYILLYLFKLCFLVCYQIYDTNCYGFTNQGYVVEYCQAEFFEPSCNEEEVVVMVSARYGHIQKGKCLDTDLGHFGCSIDLLQYLDKECSGKKGCSVLIGDTTIGKDVPCSSSLMKYLEASYTCVKVLSMPDEQCEHAAEVPVKSRLNYLQSSSTQDLGCGDEDTPWILKAKLGQQINISMVDFAWKSKEHIHQCPVRYGYLIDVAENQVTEICGGADRIKHVYMSHGSEVQIIVDKNQLPQVSFLLSYQAIGCPTFTSPKDMWMKKEDDDVIRVGCHDNTNKWKMRCIGNNWIGLVGSCSKAASNLEITETAVDKDKLLGMPPVVAFSLMGSVFFIIICITITVIIGIFCIKKPKTTKSEYYLTPHATNYHHTLSRDGNYPSFTLVDRRLVNPNQNHTLRTDNPVGVSNAGVLSQANTTQYFVLENREEQSEPIYDAVYQNT